MSETAARFSALPIEQRLADVCPGCGQHTLALAERMIALREGRSYRCDGCGIEKSAYAEKPDG